MNERIQELIEQATTKIHFRLDPNTYKHIDDPDGDLERFEFDKEKFAEVIVRECVKLQYKNVVVGGVSDYNRGRRELAEEILKHFGVEE